MVDEIGDYMLKKRRTVLKTITYIFVLLGVVICENKILLAFTSTIQLKPQLKEIRVKNLKISMPALSPDGQKIAFINFAPSKLPTVKEPLPGPSKGNLWLVDMAGDRLIKLSNRIILDDEPYVSWSPNSNSVAFGSKGEIWIVDVKTKKNIQIQKPNKKRIKAYPGYYENYFHSPTWCLKGEIIAIRNVNDIWLLNLPSKSFEKIYSPPEKFRGKTNIWSLPLIVWSNDCQKLAFDQLKLVLPQGKKREQLNEGISFLEINKKVTERIIGVNENIEYYSVFSPNNDFVTFFSRKDWDSKPAIFINDLRVKKSIKIADCEDECHMLSWSEDGSKLYFGTNKALWVVNLKTITNPIIEKKIFVKGINDLSDVFWFPKGDTLYFLKPIEGGRYLLGSLKLSVEK
jgi:Tol biopolymer transport system component